MKIGMLWFDDSPKKSMALKLEEALNYYRAKYAATPNMVYIHPAEVPPGYSILTVMGMEVKASRYISPNYYLLGVKEE